MPQSRSNKSQTPINSDAFNLTPDLATLADTLGVIVPVADRTEADAVATTRAAEGWAVSNARPLYVFRADTKSIEIKDGGGWRGAGAMIRHQEYLSSNFATSGGYVNWDIGPLTNQSGSAVGTSFSTAGPLSGQITINETGWYAILCYTVPNATLGNIAAFCNKNNGAEILAAASTVGYPAWEPGSLSVPRVYLVAGDVIRFTLVMQNGGTVNSRVRISKLDN